MCSFAARCISTNAHEVHHATYLLGSDPEVMRSILQIADPHQLWLEVKYCMGTETSPQWNAEANRSTQAGHSHPSWGTPTDDIDGNITFP